MFSFSFLVFWRKVNTQRTSVLPSPPSICVKWFGPAPNQAQTASPVCKTEMEDSEEPEKKGRQYVTQIVPKKGGCGPSPW